MRRRGGARLILFAASMTACDGLDLGACARMRLHRRRVWFETASGLAGALLTMTEIHDGITE
jgi:hypothetical protein